MATQKAGKRGKGKPQISPKTEERYQRFAEAWCECLNATKAAIIAGYSALTAQAEGSRLLSNHIVREKIEEIRSEARDQARVRVVDLINELSRIAFADPHDYKLKADGDIDLEDAHERGVSRAIASVKRKVLNQIEDKSTGKIIAVTQVEYKLWDKNKALETLGKIIGAFDGLPPIPQSSDKPREPIFDDDSGNEDNEPGDYEE